MKTELALHVLVENQNCTLNRIVSMLTRRRISIRKLSMLPTEETLIHHITVEIYEKEHAVKQLCKQIEKQVEVLEATYGSSKDLIWQKSV